MGEWHLMTCPTAPAFWWAWGMPSGTQRGWAQLPLRLMEKPQGMLTVVHAPVQSRSPLALVTLLLQGPNGWCASTAVAVGCVWYSRHRVAALHPLPADEVGHFFLFQKLALPAQATSHLMSHLPGQSQQSLAAQGSRTAVLPMEATPGKHRRF